MITNSDRLQEPDPAPDAMELLEALWGKYAPQPDTTDIRQLEQILQEAQHERPSDPRAFVEKVNALLDVFCLRVSFEDGTGPGRLRLQNNSVCIVQPRGTTRGLRSGRIRLIPHTQSRPQPRIIEEE